MFGAGPAMNGLCAPSPRMASPRCASTRFRAIPQRTRDIGEHRRPLRARPSFFPTAVRSEEHTSELQSLMRISYAVFCLKKKNNKHHTTKKDHIKKAHVINATTTKVSNNTLP